MHTTTSSQTPDFEASSRGSDKILWFQTRSCSGDTSLCRQRAMITDVRSARNAAAPKSLNDVDRCVYVLNGDHHFVRMCTSISKFQITDSPSPCTQKFRRHHSENMSLHIVLNDLHHHKMYHHTFTLPGSIKDVQRTCANHGGIEILFQKVNFLLVARAF